jgi:4-aminobutyrate aminotransferase-like enzyme/Ser/Thr protein kinase RdoA (MazF antagonist)
MASAVQRPEVSASEAAALAAERYGISARARELPGERDRNFLLEDARGARFVLKVASSAESEARLAMQHEALGVLAARARGEGAPAFPEVVPSRDGDGLLRIDLRGEALWLRVLTHVPGVPLADFRPHGPELLDALGRALARLDLALQSFDHPGAHRPLHWDLRNAAACFARHAEAIRDPARAALLRRFAEPFAAEVEPRLAELRTSVIHADANDRNVLVQVDAPGAPPRIGLIDFGDMGCSYTAGEVAIASAYAMLGKADPLAAAGRVVAGYHAVLPLTEIEIELLFPLICARLCMSAVIGAEQCAAAPDNDYLAVSQAQVYELLQKLADVHPRRAWYALRHACGLPPCPRAAGVRAWLAQHAREAASLVAPDLAGEPRIVFDFGVGSAELGLGTAADDVQALTDHVFGRMHAAGARVGAGRFGEPRFLYTAPMYGTAGDDREERRTIHLGVDLFLFAGTPLCAPFAGVVHGLADNRAPQDYGPTIVLEHRPAEGVRFFTLYGHLSGDSLAGLRVGQGIARGEPFARIGAPPENGGWPPHVHFQIVVDMLGGTGDFPGAAPPSARALWLDLCPDPSGLLGFDAAAPAAPRPAELLAERQQVLGTALSVSYRRPLHVVRGTGARLWDADAQPYLDCVNNVAHVGHCHPRVVRATQRQMTVLNTNTRYLHGCVLALARRLAATMPAPLRVCWFVNSGSEANELALRLARAHTGARDVIVLAGAYHGNTATLIDVSPYKHAGPGGAGAPEWVHVVPAPDPYAGLHREGGDLGARYADHVRAAIERAAQRPRRIAAFLCEALPSCAGQIVPPAGFLRTAFAHVRAAGGVCIADEVQTGLGRVGSHRYAFELDGVVPDIVTLGKPLGNGHPLAAVVATPEIARSFANGMEYFNTFGGNPVSCEVGLAVLDVIEEERLQENAAAVGARLRAGLDALRERFPLIGDVRGHGLFLGVELVLDRDTRAPAPQHAAHLVERMRERGILLSTDGPRHNVIKIKPPLVFSVADAEHLLALLGDVLGESALVI